MITVTCHVRDLPQPDRSALERLVGHSLNESEQIIIRVRMIPDAASNDIPATSGELPDWCNIYEGLSENEIDELDQAITRSRLSREFN